MAPECGKPIHQLPLIPANVLKKHRVHEPLDTRFRSAARLLQALWREDRGLPIGSYINEDGKRRKLGSRISEAAGRGGGNFLTPEIALPSGVRLPIARSARSSTQIGWPQICSRRCRSPSICSRPGGTHSNAPRAIWSNCCRPSPAPRISSSSNIPRPRQPEIHGRPHGLRHPDPLRRWPGPQRLRRLRDQIFRERAQAHAGTEAAPHRTLGRERPL